MDVTLSIIAAGLSEGSATLLKDFTVAMVLAAVGLALARLAKQPPVLGYLVAGMLIGPFTLPSPLISNLDTIGLLAELGLTLLLFGIGLELGWRRIRGIGVRVLVIGVIEISVLTLFGIWVASILPGIDASHGLYLGGAMAISSSAILLKSLRDTGNLNSSWGRTIVGILLVEDFAAVILLTVLAGMATTGAASLADAGVLAAKLGVFCVVVLVLGTMLGGRLMDLLSRFQSDETSLLASLGFCFLLALCATLLGLSPAAGAFLIGVVIGDTEASGRVTQLVAPVRDMFGALFFLSIGMLIDYRTLDDYIVPALVVVGVFMLGKIAADTVGSILAGRSTEDSLRVGMTMPQMGEFSLAIGRLSPADALGGSALGPILSICTAITSVLAPLSSRAALPLYNWANQRAPSPFRRIMLAVRLGVDVFWSALSPTGQGAEQLRNIGRGILINICIIAVLSAAGTGALYVAPAMLESLFRAPAGVAGLVIVGIVTGLSVPPSIGIWRSLGTLARLATNTPDARGSDPAAQERWRTLRTMVEYGLATVLISLLFLLTLPITVRLFTLGVLSVPLSVLLLILPALAVGIFSFRVHRVLEPAFTSTFIVGSRNPVDSTDVDITEAGPVEGASTSTHPEAFAADAPSEPPVSPLISEAVQRIADLEQLPLLLVEIDEQADRGGAEIPHADRSDNCEETR